MGAYPAYKKDYEAMVFIDGWDVVAINSDGSVIDHGTNWVDDSDVIQSAIDYVVSATGGGKISIGAGVFVIYTPILVKSYIQLCGEGTTTTLYAETGLDDDVIYIEDQTNCLIENMWIAGNSAGQASGSGIYINHAASTDCFNVVKDVVITDCKEYGVEISSNSDYVSLLNNIIGGCGTAPVSDPTLTSVIRDTYGHTSIQSRRDYDAMVFIEDTSVIAVDSNGVCIARGVAGTDDATVIQAAIDSVPSKGKLIIGPGTYVPGSRFTIRSSIDIIGNGKPVFQWYYPTASGYLFDCAGTRGTEDMLGDNVTAGSVVVKTTSDLTGVLSNGDLVAIYDANIWQERSDQMSPTGTITASGSAGGNTPEYSIDNDLNTYWRSDAVTGWLQYDFGAGQTIRKYGVYGVKDSADNPYSWVLQGSNDALAWIDIDTQTGVTWAKSERKFYILSDQVYRYYRLNITANAGGTNLDVREWELYSSNTGHHYYDAWKVGELHSVKKVESDQITLHEGLLHDYGKEPLGGYIVPINPISVNMGGIYMEGNDPNRNIFFVSISYARDCVIRECSVKNTAASGVVAYMSYNVIVDSCTFSDMDSTAIYGEGGLGYAFSIGNLTAHPKMLNCSCNNMRHALASGGSGGYGQARDILISCSNFSGITSTVIDAHECVESIIVSDNVIYGNGLNGVGTGSRETYVYNNKFYNCLRAVNTRGSVDNRTYIVDGNHMINCKQGVYLSGGTLKTIIITNNVCSGDGSDYEYFYIYAPVPYGVIANNSVINAGRSGIYLYAANNINISGNTLIDCNRLDNANYGYIQLANTTKNCIVQNNLISEVNDMVNSTKAVYETDTANENIVLNNMVVNLGTTPVVLVGSRSLQDIVAITDNIIRDPLDTTLEKLGTPRLLCPCTSTTGTSITDYTRLSNALTAQASVADWYGFQGRATYYDFNGTAHYLYRANDTDFDFGDAATDDAFSVVCCVNPDDVTSRQIIGKWDDNNQREWRLFFDANGYPTLQLYDESADTYIGRQDQTAFTTGSWQVIVATYDGSGINAGCKIYIDGVQLDDTDYDNGVYVAMEAVTANLMVGALKNAAVYSEYYDGKMTWIGVAAKELSPDEVWSLTQRLKGVLGI